MKLKYLSLLLLIGIMGCSKVRDPEFRKIGDFKIKSLGLLETRIGFSVTFFNPNKFGVTVKQAEADVYVDSLFLGKFIQDSSILVGKSSDFKLPLTGTVSMATALKMNLQNLTEKEVNLKADGSVKVGKAGVFITRPVSYEGKHKLDEIRIRL